MATEKEKLENVKQSNIMKGLYHIKARDNTRINEIYPRSRWVRFVR